jgi:hypothetical protein
MRLASVGAAWLALTFCIGASAATAVPERTALTKDQAYAKARGCQLRNGARSVGRRPDGGGYAIFRGRVRGSTGSAFWTYKTVLRQVSSVTVYFAGRPGLSVARRSVVKRCVTLGI